MALNNGDRMAFIPWGITKNLEYSVIQFLRDAATADGLTLQFRAEHVPDENWALPVVQVYYFSVVPGRLEIGSNTRFDTYIIMVDIRSDSETPAVDISDWIQKVLNDGCPFYEFSPNPSSPDVMLQTQKGNCLMDVFTSLPVNLGDSVDLYDKYRHRLQLKFWITN